MKFFIVPIALILAANQFTMGQDTLAHQKTISTIKTPHKFSSPLLKQDTTSTSLEAQLCKSCHSINRIESNVKDSSLPNLKQSELFFQLIGNYPFKNCSKCTKLNAPDGISSSCLYCHDGSVAYSQVYRQPGTTINSSNESGAAGTTIDLFNSHPVSVVYDPSKNQELWPLNHLYNDTNTVRELLDENNEVQCTSCHNMHNDQFPYFLRISIERSELCLSCHIR
jgi:predicted CXXCH cytochrome family protein